MKKVVSLAAMAALVIGVSASASARGGVFQLGGASMEIGDFGKANVAVMDIGFGGTNSKGIYFGGDSFFYGGKLDDAFSSSVSGLGIDFKLGYTISDVTAYGLAGWAVQTIESMDGVGFGFGGGIEYMPFETVGFGLEYSKYTMGTNYNYDYDLTVAKGFIKIYY